MLSVMKKILKTYFLMSGLTIHVGLAALIALALWVKFYDHWRVTQIQGWINGPADSAPIHSTSLDHIPAGRWSKIHQMSPNDTIAFKRQRHSGSAFDQKRNRLIIFGSDTHGNDWDNSIRAFDLNTRSWLSLSEEQPFSSYRTSAAGLAISGTKDQIAPWAMHTFDSVNYDPVSDNLIVASKPEHLKPGRFKSPVSKQLWSRASSHPTWSYNFSTQRWLPLVVDKAEHFFPYASAYSDTHNTVFGFRPNGVFKLSASTRTWKKIAQSHVKGYHTQAVWDSGNGAFVIAGNHNLSNTIHIYRPGEDQTQEMTTPGIRPSGFEHSPMAYHESSGKVAFVIDTRKEGKDYAETWLYTLMHDKWQLLPTADFPFHLGMNYHMQYVRALDALILFLQAPNSQPSVWLLRL